MAMEPLVLFPESEPDELTPEKIPVHRRRGKRVVYGRAILKGKEWHVTLKPQAMMRFKRILSKINKSHMGTVRISDTPENCADILWFSERYPITVRPLKYLRDRARGFFEHANAISPLVDGDIEPIDVELALPARKYQRVAIDLARRSKALLIADTLGLGKTICGIGLASFADCQPAVVVVKPNLADQWASQFKKFLPDLATHIIKTGKHYSLPPVPVYIISYSKLAKWSEHFAAQLRPRLLVFDEIQELRREESLKYQAARHLAAASEHIVGLSATPIYNYGDEIFNIVNILREGALGTRQEFLREWCTDHGNHFLVKEPTALGQNLLDQGLMIRRTLKDVGMEAPAYTKIIEEIPCDLNTIRKAEMEGLELAKLIVSGSFTEQGMASREFNLKMRMATGIAKAPYVASLAEIFIEQYGCVAIGGWHREVYNIWMKMLKKYNPVLYTGSETTAQKTKNVEKFVSGESQVFIMSLRSGEGLDGLQKRCTVAIHGEMDWTLKVHSQFTGRFLRPGQENPVSEVFAVTSEGSDPFICQLNGVKEAQSDGILLSSQNREVDVNVDMGRVKQMAEDFLRRKGVLVPGGD